MEGHQWVKLDEKLCVDFNRKIGSESVTGVFFGNFRPAKGEDIVPVAVHIFETRSLSPEQRVSLETEIHNLKKLKDHPNIIKYYYDLEKDERIYLALEYCPRGDL